MNWSIIQRGNTLLFHRYSASTWEATIKAILDPLGGINSPVDRAVTFMKENYDTSISAMDVAREIGFSYVHLAHLFKIDLMAHFER